MKITAKLGRDMTAVVTDGRWEIMTDGGVRQWVEEQTANSLTRTWESDDYVPNREYEAVKDTAELMGGTITSGPPEGLPYPTVA